MKLAPCKKQELSSATLTQTLCLMLACFGLCVLTAYAADPAWWSSPGTGTQSAVMPEQVITNGSIVTTNYLPNPYAVVTQGQLKQFTARAVDYLNTSLSGGAGTNLNNMVYNWAQDYANNGYGLGNIKPSDYTAMNVGQLKYIARQVYGQLTNSGYTTLYPSWIVPNSATDHDAANLGQLKEVFNFNLNLAGPSNLTASANIGGTINLSWTPPSGAPAATYLIEQQNVDGTWKVIDTVSSTATPSFAVTNLATGENPTFQIIAQSGTSASLSQTTPADSGLIAPSNVNSTTVPGVGEIDLTWQNNATDATYVQVNESLDGVNWSPIATLPPNTTSYAATNLTVGQAYYFGVSAGNN